MSGRSDTASGAITRRGFLAAGAAAAVCGGLPYTARAAARALGGALPSNEQVLTVHPGREIGRVRPEFHGQFAEHLGACVYGGLWVGPGSRIPNVDGYRALAVRYLSELGIPVLRWPGGCYADTYQWRDGVGPRAERPRTVNIAWGDVVDDNSFGTAEFIGLCRRIGAEPYLAGNVGTGSPEELRDWMEYCNFPDGGPAGSTLAQLRAKNGSPQPFGVRYWGVGNESWGCGGNLRPGEYAEKYREFATFLRPMGGVRPFLIASGPNGNDGRWTRGLMDGLGWLRPSGVSIHYYEGGADAPDDFTVADMDKQLAIFAQVEQAIQQQRAILDGYPRGRQVGLLLDEWGVWDRLSRAQQRRYGMLYEPATMRTGVAAGLGLNIFNRQADCLYMCNIAQIVNVLQSLLVTDGPDGAQCVRTTTYYAFQLFKPHRGNTAVRITPPGAGPLGLSASASKQGRELVISLVNPQDRETMRVRVDAAGAAIASARGQALHDPDLNAGNTFADPLRIVPRTLAVRVNRGAITVDLPPLAVATLRAELS
ncbi:MAG: alpha-N-arabinofuranosidase [Terriglobales bacterium]